MLNSQNVKARFTNTNNKQLDYKLNKTIKYIKKIKALLNEQGLDDIETFNCAHKLLKSSSKRYSRHSIQSFTFEEYPSEILTPNYDKFEAYLLMYFYQKHQEITQKLYENQSQFQKEFTCLGKEPFIKLEEDFPSFQQQRGISKQIKIQSDVFISTQNTFQTNSQKNQKPLSQKILIEKLERKKRQLENYLKMKLQKKNHEAEKKLLQQDQECSRKYGPKVQSQKYNHQQFDQVKKLRQKLLGKQKVNRKDNMKKTRTQNLRKTRSRIQSSILPLITYESRQVSH